MLTDLDELPFIQLGEYKLRFEVEDLSPEMREVARKELRETPEVSREAVLELRALLQDETDLLVPLDNDKWLIKFLRPCKFYPKSAKDLIKRYYAFKLKYANVYGSFVPIHNRNVFETDIFTVLLKRDQHGRRILIFELGKKWNHNKYPLDESFKVIVLFSEMFLLEPTSQVTGASVILEMDGLTMEQVWQFTPPFAKKLIDWIQDSAPIRLKNVHIVNQPYIFNMVFQLFKPFLREKLKSRIIFHGTDMNSLHKYVSPSCLPAVYGGSSDIPRISGMHLYDMLIKFEDEYTAINSYGYKKFKSDSKKI